MEPCANDLSDQDSIERIAVMMGERGHRQGVWHGDGKRDKAIREHDRCHIVGQLLKIVGDPHAALPLTALPRRLISHDRRQPDSEFTIADADDLFPAQSAVNRGGQSSIGLNAGRLRGANRLKKTVYVDLNRQFSRFSGTSFFKSLPANELRMMQKENDRVRF